MHTHFPTLACVGLVLLFLLGASIWPLVATWVDRDENRRR